ncbi:hypothetical protein M3148_00730 [Georgenia satyanarayanai]|uniref:hypothetical protein n=1 Tax=Georgenia satyanarayanai TaxID=860221 RepID=UPI00203F7E1C|nr:hypothetical protein [Georgenia satyanarayanai]MCM3659527.1 hypothetical protein [Georgenia satyanarayanai]
MRTLVLGADPDPELWVPVPSRYPDDDAATPEDWARTVAAERGADSAELLERLLLDLALSEQRTADGTVYLYLPPDGAPMQKVRLRALPTTELGEALPTSPLTAEDTVVAEYLGRGTRSIVAGLAHESTSDLLVTVVYRWDVEWVSVLLTMATLDPGEAVAMIETLDELAHDIWLEDESGELVTVTEAADV